MKEIHPHINSYLTLIFLIMIMGILISCNDHKNIDLEKERAKILELHNAQRDYHFNKDSVAFLNQLSESFTSVNRGEIKQAARSETLSRYHSYFSSVEFVKWDDISEPIIKFSDDGSMAYTIVDKIVSLTYETDSGEIVADSTHFAWTAIYRKHNGDWKIETVTSTQVPVE